MKAVSLSDSVMRPMSLDPASAVRIFSRIEKVRVPPTIASMNASMTKISVDCLSVGTSHEVTS
jgi:hypothetical protein